MLTPKVCIPFGYVNANPGAPITNAATRSAFALAPDGSIYTSRIPTWSDTHAPAVGTRATITRASAGGFTFCDGISAVFCCAPGDVATTALLHLRDGATGAGTILRSWRFAIFDAVGGGNISVNLTNLGIRGTFGTDMTLEFAAAPGAASFQSVGLSGYDTP